MKWMTVYLSVLLSTVVVRAEAPASLVVHEWGTFTSLQNERGEAIGGINIDDEPVPAFVHGLDASLVQGQPSEMQQSLRTRMKGVFTFGPHPDITMRLETPVVYFYDQRPSDKPLPPMTVDLSVTFNGGYLSQFYPNVNGPQPVTTRDFAEGTYVPVLATTTHTLAWQGLKIGQAGEGPKTDSRVWTAPREVKAANVVAANGESEKFLFYRGVGHVDSPLRVEADGTLLRLNGMPTLQPPLHTMSLTAAWLVDIRSDGSLAFKPHEVLNAPAPADGALYGFRPFTASDYSAEGMTKLRNSMKQQLVTEGLFADEANAMLNTWEASYFKSPGLRVFYIVPKGWVEQVLPLKVSVPADITRVMLGRIELVSPEQSALVKTITDVRDLPRLGRFAGALLNDENARHPSPRLANLIKQAGLEPAKVAR